MAQLYLLSDYESMAEGALDSLELLADKRDRAGMDALSLLEVNDRMIIDYPVLFPDTFAKGLTSTTSRIEKTPDQEGRLEIYPNPTERYFTLDYRVDKMHEHLTYRIIDLQGRVITEQILVNEEDQILIDSVLPSGPYLIELMGDGVRYRSADLIVK